jgi:hypothetical protein
LDGEVNLGTSLFGLVANGVTSVVAATNSGVDSVVIAGGYGSADEVTGLTFAEELDVTLQLTEADDWRDASDLSTDGTVNLNTSLSGLAAMGIDSIEAGAESSVGSVVIAGGYGSADEVTGLTFAEELDVTLQLTAADDGLGASDGTTDGTVNLNTSLSGLAAMGIDSIEAGTTSVGSVVIAGGYGSADEVTGLAFAEELDVTLQLTAADDGLDASDGSTDGTVNLNTSLSGLAEMGIDSIEAGTTSVGSVVIAGGYGAGVEITGLSFTDAPGLNDLNVTLQLTQVDDAFDASTDGTVNLHTSLSHLADMGIDSIEASTGSGVDSVVISEGFGGLTLTEISSLGLSFNDELTVTVDYIDLASLGLGDDVQSSLMLGQGDAAHTLKDMGIDFINGPDGLIELEDWPHF